MSGITLVDGNKSLKILYRQQNSLSKKKCPFYE